MCGVCNQFTLKYCLNCGTLTALSVWTRMDAIHSGFVVCVISVLWTSVVSSVNGYSCTTGGGGSCGSNICGYSEALNNRWCIYFFFYLWSLVSHTLSQSWSRIRSWTINGCHGCHLLAPVGTCWDNPLFYGFWDSHESTTHINLIQVQYLP